MLQNEEGDEDDEDEDEDKDEDDEDEDDETEDEDDDVDDVDDVHDVKGRYWTAVVLRNGFNLKVCRVQLFTWPYMDSLCEKVFAKGGDSLEGGDELSLAAGEGRRDDQRLHQKRSCVKKVIPQVKAVK